MFKGLQSLFHSKEAAKRQEAFERQVRDSLDKIQRDVRASRENIQRQLDAINANALKQRELLLSLGNAMKWTTMEPDEVKSTMPYRRCSELIALLTPMEIRHLIRVGRDFDGGYVMVDDLTRIDAAYSFGINDDVSWDEAIAGRGIEVYLYDHTIEKLPKENPRFHFFNKGLTGHKKGEQLGTLEEFIAANHHQESRNLLLKMDIEGCEWDVFHQTSSATISQFSQIVLEFHRLTPFTAEASHEQKIKVLTKLAETHQCVHVHANGASVPVWIGGLVLPSLLEVTYVRRADYTDRLAPVRRRFPTTLDQPTYDKWPDIYLGSFSVPD